MLPQASHEVVIANLQLYHAITALTGQARAKVTTECEYKILCDLSNVVISSDVKLQASTLIVWSS